MTSFTASLDFAGLLRNGANAHQDALGLGGGGLEHSAERAIVREQGRELILHNRSGTELVARVTLRL